MFDLVYSLNNFEKQIFKHAMRFEKYHPIMFYEYIWSDHSNYRKILNMCINGRTYENMNNRMWKIMV